MCIGSALTAPWPPLQPVIFGDALQPKQKRLTYNPPPLHLL